MSTPLSAHGRARGLWRWFVAAVATLLLVISGSGLVAFAQNGEAGSQGPVFAPAGSPFYAEVRLDMPGGQGEALAQFLTAFPGFADAESFPTKRDEIIGSLVEMLDSEDADQIAGLLSSLTGEIGLAITSLTPEVLEMDTDATAAEDPPMVIGLAITDRAAVEAGIAGAAADATSETYGDATLFSDGETTIGVTDGWALLSPYADEVKGAVDTLAGTNPSLASDPEFSTAWARVPADHLAALWLDLQALAPLIEAGMAQAGSMSAFGAPMALDDILAQLPGDMVAYLVAEPDRLTLEADLTTSAAMSELPVGDSELANSFPADTQLFVETRQLGNTLAGALTMALAGAGEDAAAEMAPVEDMLGAPLPEFLSFIGDAAIGAGITPESLWLGIAAETSDPALAQERVQRLLTILQLFATSPEAGISVDEQTVGDTAVTVITLPIDSAAMGLPFDIGQTVSVAVDDGELLIGTGDFVANAISGDPGASLGASAGYTDAIGEDTTNSGVVYANIGSLLAQLDPMLSMLMPEWSDISPYATAIDRFIAVGTAADDVISARMSVIVAPAE
jgi:hypothetical protein